MINIDIGGGKSQHNGWDNIDELHGFVLSTNTTFPYEDNGVDLIYSSHTIEHLNDATVNRVLAESCRVLKTGNKFVIKLPNFDKLLADYRSTNVSIDYLNSQYGIHTVSPTWHRKNIEINLENYVAYVFCGYWNEEYGEHFGVKNMGGQSYNGPPKIEQEALKNILLKESPKTISNILTAIALKDSDFYKFNHQNAWSKKEFINLLSNYHFEFEQEYNVNYIGSIPGYDEMRKVSSYYEFTK